ncbi:MAG TPA: hypothetical protein VH595_08780 [Verrucomicrobiae bacterium]|nr:hypothetical protein [Verrucomicrobiae bacterium]
MNQEAFLGELKQACCTADWQLRYYQALARRYTRIDYWLKAFLGLSALCGAVVAGTPEYRLTGACIAGGSAFVLANVLPIFKWDTIVYGLRAEEQDWTRIFQGYEEIISFNQISNREEMLVQEFQRIKELQKAATLNDRVLPKSQALLNKFEGDIREFYNLDPQK